MSEDHSPSWLIAAEAFGFMQRVGFFRVENDSFLKQQFLYKMMIQMMIYDAIIFPDTCFMFY